METLFTYLWQSAVVLTVLYVPFQLLLRKEQYYALNRAILLAILVCSLLLPLSHHTMPAVVEGWLHPTANQEVTPIIELSETQITDDIIILKQDPNVEVPSWFELHWLELLIGLWALGGVTFLCWQAKGLWQLHKMLHDRDNVREPLADGNTLLLTSAAVPSFSWMHSIVISVDDYAENGETILTHERAHIGHHHSLDRLLLLVVQALQWWNPFVWLMADAITQVHEYQADLAVLRQGINATQYQLLLIRKAAGPAGLALVNGFKRNKLKLRIVMMNNMIKLRGAKSRYLALLPMMLLAVAFTARAEVKTHDNQNTAKENPPAHYYGTWTPQNEDAAHSDSIGDSLWSADMLHIYDGNVVEFEAIKDLPPSEIAIGSMQLLKNGEVYEEYLQKYPKARNGVVILNSHSRKDQLWVVDGVPMTGEEMEAKYANDFPVKFQQLHKDAETLAKYSQYPAAKNGVNIVILKKN